MALTQTQLVTAVAERADLSKNDAKRALAALDEIVPDQLGNAQKVRIGGLVQLTVRLKPAQKARKGRNPATGEEIAIAAKPASVDLRARPRARARRGRCRRCKRRAGGSLPEQGALPRASLWPAWCAERRLPAPLRSASEVVLGRRPVVHGLHDCRVGLSQAVSGESLRAARCEV